MNELISITEYCRLHNAEIEFIMALADNGLLEFETRKSTKFINIDTLQNLERFRIYYYELHINIEGIDVIENLLLKQKALNTRISELENELRIHS